MRIEAPGSGRAATLWVDAAYEYLMVFTGDTLSPGARRRGLALEPMTCAPNALRSGDGLVVLSRGPAIADSGASRPADRRGVGRGYATDVELLT